MKRPSVLSLRLALTLLFVLTPLVALLIVGSITLGVRLPQISEANSALAKESAAEMAARLEGYLKSLEDRLEVAAFAVTSTQTHELYYLLESARGEGLEAIYLIDDNGRLVDASVENSRPEYIRQLIGFDMSGNKLFREVVHKKANAWSDTHLSAITGIVTVGVAVPVSNSGWVIIGEVPLETIVSISRITRSDRQLDLWIIDQLGELVADTSTTRVGRQNLSNLPIVSAGLKGLPLPDRITYDGRNYFAWAEFSDSLGWLVVTRIPSGMNNLATRETVTIIAIGFLATSALGALLAPFWGQVMARTVRSVIDQARMVASGKKPEAWPKGPIKEFNQLSDDLEAMANALVSREQALQTLNEQLENRVERRTRDLATTNAELSETLENLRKTQNELVESERLAALGRLVAGVAHELNTPLGNSKLSLSAQVHEIESFSDRIDKGLRKSELTAFVERMRNGASVAALNVDRACDLVSNFKQVAIDRTASYRRSFRLLELVNGTVMTLQPSISNNIEVVVGDIPERIMLDSYPGEFGQVITNLVDNAVKHAFPERSGTIRLSVLESDPLSISVTVEDDGVGMAKEVADQIFNPFFTTKFGQGGTGLGLHISYNAVVNVLGGSLTVRTSPGAGSRFTVTVPLVAPKPEDAHSAIAPLP